MNPLDLISKASSSEEIALLLSAMGQTGALAAPQANQADPMNLPSARAADMLLTALGQTSQGARRPIPDAPVNPMFQAQGQFFQQDLGNIASTEAARVLLNSLGQTGGMSEKIPMSPSTSRGIIANPGGTVEGSKGLTAEERLLVDTAYAEGNAALSKLWSANPDIPGTKLDPDNLYRDIPKTGKADTRGGMARVNQYTAEHGVTASRDPKTGQVTLTNIDKDGKPTPQSQRQVYGFNPMDSTTSGSVSSLMESLRGAKDFDTASGIAATLRTSLATAKAQKLQEATKFAENKLGIPALKAKLAAAEQLDARTPGYMPGIGDSKNTAAIRSQLNQTMGAVDGTAKSYLQSNISYAQLDAAASNAEVELNRLANKQRATDSRQATLDARREEDLYKAQENYAALTDRQKAIMMRIEPSLNKPGNEAQIVKYFAKQYQTDRDFKEVMSADPTELATVAIRGNKLARTLLAQEEAALTGRSVEDVENDIVSMTRLPNEAEAVKQWARNKSQGVVGDRQKEEKNLIGQYNALKLSTNKDQRAEYEDLKTQVAMADFKARRTSMFVNDVNSWNLADPEIRAAVEKAAGTTGQASIENVLTAYIGEKTGPEALVAAQLFKQQAVEAAKRSSKSIIAPVDWNAVSAMIDRTTAETQGFSGWMQQVNRKSMAPSGDNLMRNFIPFLQ